MQTVVTPTAGPWVWRVRPNSVYLATADANIVVMDCVRKSMQACAPRFAMWTGMQQGQPRGGQHGTMSLAHSWFDAEGKLAHPDAQLLAVSPALRDALIRAHAKLSAAMLAQPSAIPTLVAEAHAIQSGALAALEGGAA